MQLFSTKIVLNFYQLHSTLFLSFDTNMHYKVLSVFCKRLVFRFGKCFVCNVIVFVHRISLLFWSMFCSSQCFVRSVNVSCAGAVFRVEGMGCMGMVP